MVLLSIDSGEGFVKLMVRFASLNSTQRASEILLIAEVIGCDESFSNLELVFSQTGVEIDTICNDGL